VTPIILPLAPSAPDPRQGAGDPTLVEARVLQSVEDGTWLVSTGTKTMMVTSDQPLEVGQKVLVPGLRAAPPNVPGLPQDPAQGLSSSAPPSVPAQKAEALPRLLAALASKASTGAPEPAVAVAARVIEALDAHPRPADVPERALAEIRAVLRPVAAPHEPATTADVLKRAVEDTGALFEAKTARLLAAASDAPHPRLPATDVRTLVGSVLATLVGHAAVSTTQPAGGAPAREAPPTEALRAALTEAGRSALDAQVQTAAHAEAHGIWRVEIPLQFGNRQVHLDCEFEPDREADGRRGNRGPAGQLHVLVTPEGVSPLEARFSWRGEERIALDLYVDSEARAASLAPGREALAERLRSAGFAEATVDVWANPARLARWATRRPAAPPAGTALDTHA
jgi:hypothetical protein